VTDSPPGRGDPLVICPPRARRGRFAKGTPVRDAARSLGVYIESVCGGRGLCGRCQVHVTEGEFAKLGIVSRASHVSPISGTEQRYAELRAMPADRRLSCAAQVQGDLVIDVPADVAVNTQVVRKRAETRAILRDLATHLHYVEIEPPDMAHPNGDLDRVIAMLAEKWGITDVLLDVTVLPDAQPALIKGGYKATVAVHQDGGRPRIVAVWPGYRERLFGVAIDIGSTTIACHLVDLMSGRTVASAGTANPQIRFGEDLMSRVSYVMMNPEGRVLLTDAVRDAVNALIVRVGGQGGVAAEEIVEAVLVGNPIMHHLYLGIDPTPLGQAPFPLAVSQALDLRAQGLGLPILKSGRAYLLPCIAGHVGADAAAVTLAEAPHKSREITLVIDVGTNAEIVLGSAERLLAASSPTGPAFEGAQISSGQRAAPGAIERVRIDPQTLEPRFKVIDVDVWSDEPGFAEGVERVGVTGICGSGIIEVIAELFLAGVITHDGMIDGAPDPGRPHLLLCPVARAGRDQGHAERRPRDPAGQGSALCRRPAADGQARRRQGRPHQARRSLRQPYRSQARARAGPGARLPSRQGRLGRQRRRHRRPHGPAQPRPSPRNRGAGAPHREDRDRHRTALPGALRQRHGLPEPR
jgi:uncharacterized 2Fe-2S/4Fe-4S cluster protein (DUF4445 family)